MEVDFGSSISSSSYSFISVCSLKSIPSSSYSSSKSIIASFYNNIKLIFFLSRKKKTLAMERARVRIRIKDFIYNAFAFIILFYTLIIFLSRFICFIISIFNNFLINPINIKFSKRYNLIIYQYR